MNKLRVLCLCDYQADFLAHTILTGLWEMENVEVYEMPILQSVRGRIDEGYDLPDGTRGMTGCTGYLQPNPLPEQNHTEEEISDLGWNNFDLIVATSGREYVRRTLHTLNNKFWWNYNRISERLVICDGEDSSYVDRDFLSRWRPRVFFKRELERKYSFPAYESAYGVPTFPLQFGSFTRSLPEIDDTQKDYDIFVSLGRTNPIRDKAIIVLLEAVYDKQVCASGRAWIATNSNSPIVEGHKYGLHLHDLLPWNEYMEKQGKSKIGISLIGFGNDCLHSWELFSQKTCVLYQNTGLHIPYPFRNLEHCIYFDEKDLSNLPSQIKHALLNWDIYHSKIAQAGKEHCHKYHSTKARAKYLIDISMKILGREKVRLDEFGL